MKYFIELVDIRGRSEFVSYAYDAKTNIIQKGSSKTVPDGFQCLGFGSCEGGESGIDGIDFINGITNRRYEGTVELRNWREILGRDPTVLAPNGEVVRLPGEPMMVGWENNYLPSAKNLASLV
jgi:hypothetical protein